MFRVTPSLLCGRWKGYRGEGHLTGSHRVWKEYSVSEGTGGRCGRSKKDREGV